MFYVYVYLDYRKPGNYVYGDYSFEYEPFYVGKGSNGRAYVHLNKGCGNIHNKHFKNKIKKILLETGSNPGILIYMEMLDEKISYSLEMDMIRMIGRNDLKLGPLCNLTNGGEGINNPSIETRHRMSVNNCMKKEKNKERMMGINNPSKRVDVRKKLSDLGKAFAGKHNPNCGEYEVFYPDMGIRIIRCLKQWCVDNNFSYSKVIYYIKKQIMFDGFRIKKVMEV